MNKESDPGKERERDITSRSRPTGEVASEGGGPGEVEISSRKSGGRGSEATEVWRHDERTEREVRGDETGTGKRNP
jgi:hypothetical protein